MFATAGDACFESLKFCFLVRGGIEEEETKTVWAAGVKPATKFESKS